MKKSHVGETGGAVRGTEVPDSALATVIAMLFEARVDKGTGNPSPGCCLRDARALEGGEDGRQRNPQR